MVSSPRCRRRWCSSSGLGRRALGLRSEPPLSYLLGSQAGGRTRRRLHRWLERRRRCRSMLHASWWPALMAEGGQAAKMSEPTSSSRGGDWKDRHFQKVEVASRPSRSTRDTTCREGLPLLMMPSRRHGLPALVILPAVFTAATSAAATAARGSSTHGAPSRTPSRSPPAPSTHRSLNRPLWSPLYTFHFPFFREATLV